MAAPALPAATFLEFTPPANRSKAVGPKEDDTPLFLILAPFNPPAKVCFEETKIHEVHTKTIIVRNPSSSPVTITLDKLPDPTSGLTLSAREFCIEPCSQYTLTVIWQAVTSENCRHVIHVKDGRRDKKISEIIVTATCVTPVKKRGRFVAKKFVPLRTKIISNKVYVTSPKASAPRPALKNKSPLTAATENSFVFQENNLKSMPANAPATPRQQTFDAENKENASPPSKRKSKKISSSGFRDTMMEPPPMFSTQRKRKVLNETVSLEIEKCLSHQDAINTQSKQKVLNKTVSLEIDKCLSRNDEFLKPNGADNQRTQLRRSTFSMNSPGSCSLAPPTNYGDASLLESGISQNESQVADRFSIDSLNGPESVDVSSESSDVFVMAKDSLESNSNVPSGIVSTVNSQDICKIPEPNPNFTHVIKRECLPCTDNAIQSNSISVVSRLNFSSTVNSGEISNSSPCGVDGSAPNSTQIDEPHFSPINFSPSYDLKRCTYIKNDPRTPLGKLNFSPNSPWTGEPTLAPFEFSPTYDFKRSTFVKNDPRTPSGKSNFSPNFPKAVEPNLSLLVSPPNYFLKRSTYIKNDPRTPSKQSESPTPCNLSYTILDEDVDSREVEESFYNIKLKTPQALTNNKRDESLCDLKLKTPQALTNNKGDESLCDLKLKTPLNVEEETNTYSFFNIKLRTPRINSSPTCSSINELPNRKCRADPSCNIGGLNSLNTSDGGKISSSPVDPISKCSLRPIKKDLQSIKEVDPSEESKISSESGRKDSLGSIEDLIDGPISGGRLSSPCDSQRMDCSNGIKVVPSLSRSSHFSNDSALTLSQDVISSSVASNYFSHKLVDQPIISPSKPPSNSEDIQSRIPTTEEKGDAFLNFIEISPPKKHSIVESKPQIKFRPTRILAKSISAKTVISPSLKMKRLTSTVRKTNIAPQRSLTSSCLLVKPGTSKNLSVERSISSARKPPRPSTSKIKHVSFSGVPMSSLKLKTEVKINSKSVLPLVSQKVVKTSNSDSEKLTENLKKLNPFETKKSGIFQNPEQYIKSLSQPAEYLFLFSSTSKADPFMTNSLYYDPEWLDRQETDLIKWLNSLLTPPTELEANSDGLWRVDVAALWRKSQAHSKVELAQSRETVSSQYLLKRDRLDLVRKAASTLFCSDSIAPVFSKLAVSINKKVLSIRDDRDLHLDRGLQCKVLNLLLCYNPLWLRIGLETIYGRPIALQSNSDVIGLTSFIHKNFLSDSYLKKKHSHVKVPSLYLSTFADAMKKFILRKFFMLVYFLDQAKMRKLIRHDPCLFVTNSPYKESRELVIEFTKDLVAGLSDITKYLRTFGYVLQHKQTILHEFNYAITSRQDLRDGVRLTRVMEIILSVHSLSSKLRMPAISRLQKVHNVDIALGALQSAGYAIQGDIKSKDIVDGHREKTLSLLWQIIYRFQAPRYEKAAIRLQEWWKKNSLRLEIFKRIRAKRLARQNEAAKKIQALWRGFYARTYIKLRQLTIRAEYLKLKDATIFVQRKFRAKKSMENCRKEYQHLKLAALFVQRKFRALKLVKLERATYLSLKSSAVLIQQKFRAQQEMKKQRVEYLKLKDATIFVQRKFRAKQLMENCRIEYQRLKLAALFVQRKFRALKLGKLERASHLSLKSSAILIQRKFRAQQKMKKQRAEYLKLIEVTKSLQTTFRKNRLAKQCRAEYLVLKHSVTFIQQRFRAMRAMKLQQGRFMQLKAAVIFVQNRYRANRLMQADQRRYLQLKQSAIKIQTLFRSRMAAKRSREEFLNLKSSVIFIQRRFREKKLLQKDRNDFLKLKTVALFVQRRYRANKWMENCRKEYQRLKFAALFVQRKFRALKLGKLERASYLSLKSSAILIQRKFRAQQEMKKQRAEYLKLIEVTKSLQTTFRKNRLAKQCRAEYLALKHSVTFIQQRFRAMRAMKLQQEKFMQLKAAVIFVQNRYRANRLMQADQRRYLQLKQSAIKIQTLFRARMTAKRSREEFLNLKSSVIFIQRRFREKKLLQKDRNDFLKLKTAALFVQRRYRANNLMENCRNEYQRLKLAALFVQRKFRALKLGKLERASYLSLKSSAILIQRKFRAQQEMKKQRAEYLKLIEVTKSLQTTFRKNRLAKQCRAEYLALKHSVTFIQQHFRAMRAMKLQQGRFMQLKAAVIFVQNRYRANRLMQADQRRYLQLKQSAIKIQTLFRSRMAAKRSREEFLNLKSSVIFIQRRFREKKLLQKDRNDFLKLKTAALFVQRRYRANNLMENCRNEYQRLKLAALFVQRKCRALKLGKLERASYLSLKSSAILIQRKFRAQQKMKKQRAEYLKLIEVTKSLQTTFRKNRLAKQCRAEYLALKHSVTFIQQRFRAMRAMKLQQEKFMQLKAAVIFVQNRFRANRLMQADQRRYLQLKQSAIKIQTLFRARMTAKRSREEFLNLKSSVIFIQRRFREKKLLQKDRNDFLKLKTAALFVQRRYRANKWMENCRKEYQRLKLAALFVQRKFRALKQVKLERKEYLRLRSSVIFIQQKFRGRKLMVTEMKRYQECLKNKQELFALRAENQKRNAAAVKIQALWRGYKSRKEIELPIANQGESRRITNVVPIKNHPYMQQLTLQNRYELALSQISSSNADLQELISAFMNLDTVTYLSPKLCLELVKQDLIYYVYQHLQVANRSIPYQELCVAGIRILINLARYRDTANILWEETLACNAVNILLHFLKKHYEKNQTLFCHVATLLWLFSDDPNKAIIIRENVLCAKTMTSIFEYLQRKSLKPDPKMKQKQPAKKVMPLKNAAWGLGSQSTVFIDPFLSIIETCKKLQIPLNDIKRK